MKKISKTRLGTLPLYHRVGLWEIYFILCAVMQYKTFAASNPVYFSYIILYVSIL